MPKYLVGVHADEGGNPEQFYEVWAPNPDVAIAMAFARDEGMMDFELEGEPDEDYLALAKMYCRILAVEEPGEYVSLWSVIKGVLFFWRKS